MSVELEILKLAGPPAGKYVAKILIDEHLSREDATKLKEFLGLSTPDLRPKLDEISGKIDKLADVVKGVEMTVTLQKFDSILLDLKACLDGYVDAFDRVRTFARDHQAALRGGTASPALRKEGEDVYEQLQAACRSLLGTRGAAHQAHQLIAAASAKTAAHDATLFEVLHRIYRRECLDVFTYSTRMNRIYNALLVNILMAVRATEEAREVYLNPDGKALRTIDMKYKPLHDLHRAYLAVTGRSHRLAHRLRALAGSRVMFRRAMDDVRRDNLFLAGFSPGNRLSEVPSVGTGAQHGQPRTAYDIGNLQSKAKNSPPQIMVPTVAIGATHRITVNNKPAWALVIGPIVHMATAPVTGVFGGAAGEAIASQVVNSSADNFVHTTASQLWTIGVVTEDGQEFLTLRHAQSDQYLACEKENWRAKLDSRGEQIRWRPILCDKDVPFPSTEPDDQLAFRLRGSQYGGKLLTTAADLSVTCNLNPDDENQAARWQVISATTVPEAIALYPGCFITSANLEYSLRYTSDGKLSIHGKDGAKVRDIDLPVVGHSAGKPGKLWMQDDGNLVQYDDSAPPKPLRASNTGGKSFEGSVLVLGNDGSLKIISPTGKAVFTR